MNDKRALNRKYHDYNKIKILIGIPCLLTGGTEMHTLDLVGVLTEAGYKVTVCCYFEFESDMVQEMERAGARVRLLRLVRRREGKWKPLPRLAWNLRKVIQEERPSVFHVQYLAPGALPALIGRLFNVPHLLATLHTPGHVYSRRLWTLRLIARQICSLFICVSLEAEKAIFGNAALFSVDMLAQGRRHFTIFNGVDFSEMDRLLGAADSDLLRRRWNLGDRPVVGVVSRLNPVKGIDWLLESFALVVRELPEARLLVVGDGESRDLLLQQAHDLGVDDKVVWAGKLAREKALESYSVMDVVGVPSRFEGFGLSAAEAMGAGRPVVAMDADGLRDLVIDGKTGFRVPVGDTTAFANWILDLLSNKDKARAMGRAGRQSALKNFDSRLFQRNWEDLYQAIL